MDYLAIIVPIVISLFVMGVCAYGWSTVWGPMMKKSATMVENAQGMIRAQTAAADVRVSGIPAQARVVEVRPTGCLINFNPQCQVDMDVYPQGAQSYRVSTLSVVPQISIPRVQPGLVVPVKLDRSNPMHVVLDL